jgi:S-methylmethionine-dependent homocysteine/selenocysteine methylase
MEILDGAIGTELIARGVRLEGADWSARAIRHAPEVLSEVHAAYAEAGATLHTANTFRTQPGVLGDRWRDDLRSAVAIAKAAVPEGQKVLGSIAPIEDCYRPDLSPGSAALPRHRETARALAEAGCDVLLCETFAHEAEALAALEAARETGLPAWLSLTAGPLGDLLTPSDVARIGREAVALGVDRLLANCIAASRIAPFVEALVALDVPIGVYANAGARDERLGWDDATDDAADRYVELAERWAALGATVIGGCCGTGPLHIRALSRRFGSGAGDALGRNS